MVIGPGCGLRQGEVFGLPPKDLDFERGVIRARGPVQLRSAPARESFTC